MLVWLAEHLVKYYSGFNVFSYLTFSRHCQPADRAVHLSVDGPAHDRPSAKTLLWPGCT
ncbi:phospho-N-acetylmuramoyl-pentapeptide-transferase [Klebsiella michiganensis]|uniref:Phospho-N-acetylmuramoyl-pentapeptide-transferase n=1 Tax=Klebsiella michiganensis TaxID=1134687 RepID=A0A7H4N7N1_9ENTR|nr:phospho-N-acetylmuramoyl-pentapeptide-transferase [Klebsiella michiganensis]